MDLFSCEDGGGEMGGGCYSPLTDEIGTGGRWQYRVLGGKGQCPKRGLSETVGRAALLGVVRS